MIAVRTVEISLPRVGSTYVLLTLGLSFNPRSGVNYIRLAMQASKDEFSLDVVKIIFKKKSGW